MGKWLSVKMLARYAMTRERLAFWHVTVAGHASKLATINIETALGKIVVVENKPS